MTTAPFERQAVVARLDALEREARALRAQLAAQEAPLAGGAGLLLVRVGATLACFALEPLDEVVPMARLTALPEAPPWASGALDRAGVLIPVLDILARIERRSRPALLSDCIVLASAAGRRVGLVVQEVLGLRSLGAARIEPAPAGLDHGPYVTGVVSLEEGRAVVLSPGLLVDTSDLPAVAPAGPA